jgi:hypothetical protein
MSNPTRASIIGQEKYGWRVTAFLPALQAYTDVDVSAGTRIEVPARDAIVLIESDEYGAWEVTVPEWTGFHTRSFAEAFPE